MCEALRCRSSGPEQRPRRATEERAMRCEGKGGSSREWEAICLNALVQVRVGDFDWEEKKADLRCWLTRLETRDYRLYPPTFTANQVHSKNCNLLIGICTVESSSLPLMKISPPPPNPAPEHEPGPTRQTDGMICRYPQSERETSPRENAEAERIARKKLETGGAVTPDFSVTSEDGSDGALRKEYESSGSPKKGD